MYYEAVGQKYIPEDRAFKHSMPRCAIGVALSKYVGDSITAAALEKDRTTVIHYKRRHAQNMMYWDGYEELFEMAEHVVDSYLNEMAKLDRMAHLDKMINQFVKEKTQIQSTINV